MNADKLLDKTMYFIMLPAEWSYEHTTNPWLRLLMLPVFLIWFVVVGMLALPVLLIGTVINLMYEK